MKSKEQVLKQVYEHDNKQFGRPNDPRTKDPSMFELLTWKEDKDEPWDFKKNVNPERENEAKKFNGRINHEKSQWLTENQDNYRKIETLKLQDQKLVVQKLGEQTIKNIASSCDCKVDHQNKQQIQQIEEHDQNYRMPADWNPKVQSAYREQYQVKDIKDNNELMQQLEQNSKNFKGHYKVVQPTGNYYYDEEKKQEQQEQTNSEEEDSLIDADNEAKKMNTKFNRSAKILDPNNPEDQQKLNRRLNRIKQFQGQTRWLADTAFTTYFGKPAWGAYGQANVNPTVGGIIYGQHMLSHNIQPHRQNDPQYLQSYQNALRYGANVAQSVPEPPRNCREEDRLNPEQVESLKQRNQLTATPYEEIKKQNMDKTGKCTMPHLTIKKPDLVNTLRFASEAGSVENDYMGADPNYKFQQKNKQKEKEKQKEQEQEKEKEKDQSKQQKQQKQQKQHKRPLSAQGNAATKQTDRQSDKQSDKSQKLKPQQKQTDKNKQSKQKQEQKYKVAFQSDQKEPQQLEDSLAIPNKSQNKFIDELRQKKEKANRLTMKVNEVNPSQIIQRDKQQPAVLVSSELMELKSFDDKHPPKNYLQQLDPVELNPKYYKGVPSDWLKRIPSAGQKHQEEKPTNTKECFDYGF